MTSFLSAHISLDQRFRQLITGEEFDEEYPEEGGEHKYADEDDLWSNVRTIDPIGLSIVPNPANQEVSIRVEGDKSCQLMIYTSQGLKKWVSNMATGSQFKIDISSWHTGIYLVTLFGKNGLILDSKKLIIEK